MRNNYNTKQKDLIIDKIKSINHEFTIKELYDLLSSEVGLTTIYRFIDKLVIDKKIEKFIGKDNNTYYQYLEECNCMNHFYLKCDVCGEMIHVDCDCINELFSHIDNEHKFVPNREHIIIGGICDKCRR